MFLVLEIWGESSFGPLNLKKENKRNKEILTCNKKKLPILHDMHDQMCADLHFFP